MNIVKFYTTYFKNSVVNYYFYLTPFVNLYNDVTGDKNRKEISMNIGWLKWQICILLARYKTNFFDINSFDFYFLPCISIVSKTTVREIHLAFLFLDISFTIERKRKCQKYSF